MKIPLSVLELAPIRQGYDAADAFKNSLQLARHTESLGYNRFWLAEHHNMESIASSATAVLIGYIANGTSKIRVGSGGIMLPNHAPLIIAEQFGTLASLFPDRIDLGLGRAPGTDQVTAMALRRDRLGASLHFDQQVKELQMYFSTENRFSKVRAIPGEGLNVPVWILGSSTDSAYLAAQLGLPYAFASHFAPDELHAALQIYHQRFSPSPYLQKPYTMACINVIVAQTNEEAQYHASSFIQLARGIVTGERKPLPPPLADLTGIVNEFEMAAIRQRMTYSFIGNKDQVSKGLNNFISMSTVDELMVVSHIYDPDVRKKSYTLLKELEIIKA